MAFRFGDPGGRGYNAVGTSNVNQLAWWNGTSSTPSAFTITASGSRVSGNSIHFLANAPSRYISKTLDAQQTWGIAFAVKFSSIPNNSSIMFSLIDGGTLQCDLRVNTDGTLTVTRSSTALGTTTVAIQLNVWTHVEWKTKIDNTTGTTEVRINGVSAGLALTAQDTQATGNSTANGIVFGNLSGSVTYICDYDDIIIWDGQTTDPQGNPDIHDFIGDCGLAWLLPNGDGTTTQFSRDSGTNNYLRVNEATPDGDTSYTYDATVNHIDTYAMADLPAGATGVKSLMAVSYLRKDDVGNRVVAPVIRTNSANFVGANVGLGTSYQYASNAWGQNPSGTPAAWTVSDVNAIEGGAKVIS